MNQNERYQIIKLLCTSESENIKLAQMLCNSQGWDLTEILKEFGYWEINLKRADDFRHHILDCSKLGLNKLPDLLPANLESLFCFGNQLTTLPNLPAKLQFLSCGNNKLTILPSLPAALEWLDCQNNQLTILPSLPAVLRWLDCQNNPISNIAETKARAPKNCQIYA